MTNSVVSGYLGGIDFNAKIAKSQRAAKGGLHSILTDFSANLCAFAGFAFPPGVENQPPSGQNGGFYQFRRP
jgi:hypothetical protein